MPIWFIQLWLLFDVSLFMAFLKRKRDLHLPPCLTTNMILTHPVSVYESGVRCYGFHVGSTSQPHGKTYYSPHHHHIEETSYFHLTSKSPVNGLTGICS